MFEEKVCPNCKNSVRDEAVFCLDCGERIDDESFKRKTDDQKSQSTDKIKAVKLKNPSFIDNIISDDLLSFDIEEDSNPYLSIIEGVDKGVKIPVDERLFLGRKTSGTGWKLSDPYISREHVEINRVGEDYILKNLSETNGTKVNGVKVEEHRLSPGDLVEIGFTVMSFQKNENNS